MSISKRTKNHVVARCKGQGQRYLRGGRQCDVKEKRNKSSHNSATIELHNIKQDKESVHVFIQQILIEGLGRA